MAQFTRGPMDTGFSQTPHGLWTLDVSTGARCLLGWLHSHTDQYLQSVTQNMAERVLRTSSVRGWLTELAEAGFLTVTKHGPGKANTYELLVEPWVALFSRRKHRAETGAVRAPDRAETGAPESARVEDHCEETTTDARFARVAEPAAQASASVVCRAVRDELFQALVSACGMTYDEMTARQRTACGKAMAELMVVGATPDEVHRRAAIYPQKFHTVLTPNALANQWAALREPGAPPGPAREGVMDRVRAQLAAERLADNVVALRGAQ